MAKPKREDITKELVEYLYFVKKMTLRDVSSYLGIHHSNLLTTYIKPMNIELRDRKEMTSGDNHWKYCGDKNKVKCSYCGKEFRTNHLDRNNKHKNK